ncbi:WD40 repeat domain-containing protein [Candidatus Poribacteria bacterium]|nr:WD40 repeat domain-containing protein [Candidatus Poribacteria bacterium]
MRFSPDGSILAIGGQGGVYLWDVATGTGHSASTGHSAAFWLHFSPDGDTLTTHTEDNNVHLWDVATGTLRYTFDTATDTSNEKVCFSPDGSIFAVGGWNGAVRLWTVRLWDVATGTLRDIFNEDTPDVQVMRFSPDGSILAIGDKNEKIQLWDVATGTLHKTLPGGVYDVSFSPDSHTLATRSSDLTIRLWDVATGKVRQSLEWEFWESIQNVRFSPDGSTLAFVTQNGHLSRVSGFNFNIGVTHVTTGVTDKACIGFRNPPSLSPTLSFRTLSFSPDGSMLAIGSGDGVHLLDVPTDTVHNILEKPHFLVPGLSSLSFSPDGGTLAVGVERSYYTPMPSVDPPLDQDELPPAQLGPELDSPTLFIWDITTGQQKPFLGNYVHSIYSVCFNANDGTLAVAAGSGPNAPPLAWDESPGALNKTNIDLWDTSTDTLITTLEAPYLSTAADFFMTEVCFSPDGRTLAAVGGANMSGEGGGIVHLWDIDANTYTYRRILTEQTHTRLRLSFSPDSSTLATGSWDSTVRLWDVSTGALHKVLTVGPWGLTSVNFSPNGDMLATGSNFGTVILWEVSAD